MHQIGNSKKTATEIIKRKIWIGEPVSKNERGGRLKKASNGKEGEGISEGRRERQGLKK